LTPVSGVVAVAELADRLGVVAALDNALAGTHGEFQWLAVGVAATTG
jgi:hypothetical protein